MYNVRDFEKQLRDEELRAVEREEMESLQRISGHSYASPYQPDKSEMAILLEHTDEIIRECQDEDGDADLNTNAELISEEILTRSNREMTIHNRLTPDSGFRYKKVKQLPPFAVTKLILSNPDICLRKIGVPAIKIESDDEQYIPAIRGEDGTFSYLMKDGSNEKLNALIRRYNRNATKQYIAEIYACIRDSAELEKVDLTLDENLVPVNNGVWDFDIWENTHDWTKAFISNTDPEYDKYTFMTKLPIDYSHDAENPIIHDDTGDWDVVTWIDQLMNRDGQHPLHTQFLYELIHCAVRVNTCFGMGVWFLDESKYSKGGQGKGTFCQLLRSLVKDNRCKDTEVYYLEDPRKLSGLEKCNAIISDEASHHYIKHGANYKRLQRGEPVSVKTLYKDEYITVFKGLILHCLNEPLTFAERTGSVERTRVVLTWKTSYTDPKSGFKENKKIKNDYVKRPEVLRYLLKHTLEEMNITEFSQECLDALEPNLQVVRDKTNSVIEFLNEFEDEFVWDRVPFKYLFQLFGVWYTDTHSVKSPYKLDSFIDDVALWADNSKEFEFHPQSFRPCFFMCKPEPLTKSYGLGYPWVKQNALIRRYNRGECPLEDCVPQYDSTTTYKDGGLFRKGTKGTVDYKGKDWDEAKEDPLDIMQVFIYDYTHKKGDKLQITIAKKYFMIHELEDSMTIFPVNMKDTQSDNWPLKIDKKLFDINYSGAEINLTSKTNGIGESYRPIREAINKITECNSEEYTDKQQEQDK